MCVYVWCKPIATTGHEDGEGGTNGFHVCRKTCWRRRSLCCLWRTRETNQMWIIFLLFQPLSFAAFSSFASSVTTQRAGLRLWTVEGESHTRWTRMHSLLPFSLESTQHLEIYSKRLLFLVVEFLKDVGATPKRGLVYPLDQNSLNHVVSLS